MLGSTAKEDQCRVCGGDGTTCTSVQGIAEQNDFQTGTDRDNHFLCSVPFYLIGYSNDFNLKTGYNDVLLIPVGATNIKIREVKSSNNYLGIKKWISLLLSGFHVF